MERANSPGGPSHLTAATVRKHSRLVNAIARKYSWAMPQEDLQQAIWARLASRPVGGTSMTEEGYIASQATCACIDEVRRATTDKREAVTVEFADYHAESDPWTMTERVMDLTALLGKLPDAELRTTLTLALNPDMDLSHEYETDRKNLRKDTKTWLTARDKLRRLARET